MRRRLAPQPIAGSAKAVGAARVAIRRQGPLVSRSARHRRGQTVGQILGRLAGGGRRPMEHARGPRHRLALAQQQDTGVIGQDHQRQRSERKGTRPLLPLPGFRQRPGEGRGNGGTRAGRAEMICGVLRCGPGFSGALSGWLGLPVLITALAGEPLEPDRVATMIEALTRLGPEKVNANPKLKEALEKVLEATKGTPQFVELVRDFNVKDQDATLLELAIKNPNNSTGVEATRLILANRNFQLVTASVAGTNAIKVAEALGNSGENGIVPLLEPMVADMKRDVALRKQAVRALAQAQEGAAALLKLAKEEKLPQDMKLMAGSELNNIRWAKIKTEAAQRSEEHTSELQSQSNLVCRLLLEKKKNTFFISMSSPLSSLLSFPFQFLSASPAYPYTSRRTPYISTVTPDISAVTTVSSVAPPCS